MYNLSVRINEYFDVVYRTLLALLTICGSEFNGRYHYAVIFHNEFTVQGIYNFFMNSKERHELRYQRRKQRRLENKRKFDAIYCDYDKVFTFDNLYQSYKLCCKGVGWKSSTHKYRTNALFNVNSTYKSLRDGTFKTKGFYEFNIIERGKPRHIQSVHISERVVQRCLCDYSLVPILKRSFIYDNGACLKYRGIDFALNRMNRHLEKYYRHYGSEGYALVFDFSKYFNSIDHDILLGQLREKIPDSRIFNLVKGLVDDFGERGLGLGSQISQSCALALPNKLDHYIKEELGIKYYIRYMDDGCIIHHSKEHLQHCLKKIYEICDELGIVLNKKKTQIVKLSRGVGFLKTNFFLTRTGKIVRKPYKKNITHMRRKLKTFRRWVDECRMTLDDVSTSLSSWRGHQLKFNSYWARQRIHKLYVQLFYWT